MELSCRTCYYSKAMIFVMHMDSSIRVVVIIDSLVHMIKVFVHCMLSFIVNMMHLSIIALNPWFWPLDYNTSIAWFLNSLYHRSSIVFYVYRSPSPSRGPFKLPLFFMRCDPLLVICISLTKLIFFYCQDTLFVDHCSIPFIIICPFCEKRSIICCTYREMILWLLLLLYWYDFE